MTLAKLIASACLVAGSVAATASPLLTVEAGKLTRASGVLVAGVLYDVEFLDGSCNALFGGCSSFAFNTQAEADAASDALFGQVLLDSAAGLFNADPLLVRGIEALAGGAGRIETPYERFVSTAGGNRVATSVAKNFDGSVAATDVVVHSDENPAGDLAGASESTWARWTIAPTNAAPEPASGLLVALALAGAAGTRRRRR